MQCHPPARYGQRYSRDHGPQHRELSTSACAEYVTDLSADRWLIVAIRRGVNAYKWMLPGPDLLPYKRGLHDGSIICITKRGPEFDTLYAKLARRNRRAA